MYADALPAGSFRGVGSMYASRTAAYVPREATQRALSQVGIAGLAGDPNLCSDPGWQFARGLMQGAGDFLSQYGAARNDTGFRTAGSATSAVGNAWAATCMSQAQSAGTAQPTETPDQVYARARQELLANEAQARSSELQLQIRAQQTAAQQSQRNLLLIGGGVLAAAAVVGAVVFLRRR